MALPRDPQRRSSVSSSNNLLENSFEDNGESGQLVLDMLTLENDAFQRCLSAQPAPTAPQRFNRCKCAHLLRDLAATADLLDLTRRWWSEAEDPDIDVNDVYTLAAAAYILHLTVLRKVP